MVIIFDPTSMLTITVYLCKLEQMGYPINTESYNIILQSYKDKEQWDEIRKVVNDMNDKGMPLNDSTFVILMEMYGATNKVIFLYNIMTL